MLSSADSDIVNSCFETMIGKRVPLVARVRLRNAQQNYYTSRPGCCILVAPESL